MKKRKIKSKHCSAVSNSTRCNLNSKEDVLKITNIGRYTSVIAKNNYHFPENTFKWKEPDFKLKCKKNLKEHKLLGVNL